MVMVTETEQFMKRVATLLVKEVCKDKYVFGGNVSGFESPAGEPICEVTFFIDFDAEDPKSSRERVQVLTEEYLGKAQDLKKFQYWVKVMYGYPKSSQTGH